MKSWIFFLGLVLLIPVAQATSLDQFFRPDTLGSQVSYWEHQMGPAWKVIGATHIYKLNECEVSVGVQKGVIQWMSMDLSSECNPDISGFMSSSKPIYPYNMTFGSWQGGGDYYADCLSMCGNAAPSYIHLFIPGYHANNFIDITLSSSMEEDPAMTQSLTWESTMEAKEGQDYVIDTRFNCDHKYAQLAKQLLKPAKINQITVGVDTAAQFCKSH